MELEQQHQDTDTASPDPLSSPLIPEEEDQHIEPSQKRMRPTEEDEQAEDDAEDASQLIEIAGWDDAQLDSQAEREQARQRMELDIGGDSGTRRADRQQHTWKEKGKEKVPLDEEEEEEEEDPLAIEQLDNYDLEDETTWAPALRGKIREIPDADGEGSAERARCLGAVHTGIRVEREIRAAATGNPLGLARLRESSQRSQEDEEEGITSSQAKRAEEYFARIAGYKSEAYLNPQHPDNRVAIDLSVAEPFDKSVVANMAKDKNIKLHERKELIVHYCNLCWVCFTGAGRTMIGEVFPDESRDAQGLMALKEFSKDSWFDHHKACEVAFVIDTHQPITKEFRNEVNRIFGSAPGIITEFPDLENERGEPLRCRLDQLDEEEAAEQRRLAATDSNRSRTTKKAKENVARRRGRRLLEGREKDPLVDTVMNRELVQALVVAHPHQERTFRVNIAKMWFNHPSRSTAIGHVFVPVGKYYGRPPPCQYFNHWRGFRFESEDMKKMEDDDIARDRAKMFFDHIRLVWCQGDPDLYDFVRYWMKCMLNQPHELFEGMIFVAGPNGAGKGKIVQYLSRIVGPWQYVQTTRHADIMGKFTDSLANKLLVFIDEAQLITGSGNGSVTDGDIKRMCTEPKMRMRRMYHPTEEKDRYNFLIGATNNEYFLTLDHDARRFVCLQASADHCGDTAYFDALDAAMMDENERGLKGVAYEIYHGIKDGTFSEWHRRWHHGRVIPMSPLLLFQKLNSLKPHQRFVENMLKSATSIHPNHLDDDSPDNKTLREMRETHHVSAEEYVYTMGERTTCQKHLDAAVIAGDEKKAAELRENLAVLTAHLAELERERQWQRVVSADALFHRYEILCQKVDRFGANRISFAQWKEELIKMMGPIAMVTHEVFVTASHQDANRYNSVRENFFPEERPQGKRPEFHPAPLDPRDVHRTDGRITPMPPLIPVFDPKDHRRIIREIPNPALSSSSSCTSQPVGGPQQTTLEQNGVRRIDLSRQFSAPQLRHYFVLPSLRACRQNFADFLHCRVTDLYCNERMDNYLKRWRRCQRWLRPSSGTLQEREARRTFLEGLLPQLSDEDVAEYDNLSEEQWFDHIEKAFEDNRRFFHGNHNNSGRVVRRP
jgi:hypothetical protein